MEPTGNTPLSTSTVNYDDSPLAEVEVAGIEYRLDAGHGSALAISSREPGTWTWSPVAEGRWDGVQLRARGLEFTLRETLAKVLAGVMNAREEGLA
jgi:hypothetical protein